MSLKKKILLGTPLASIPAAAMASSYGAAYRAYPDNVGKTVDNEKSLDEINDQESAGYIHVKLDDGTYKIGISCPNNSMYENKCSEKGQWKIELFKKID